MSTRTENSPGFRGPGQKKFTRLRSLKDGYSQGDILSIIVGEKELSPARKEAKKIQAQRVNLLVDIQAKLAEGKGAGVCAVGAELQSEADGLHPEFPDRAEAAGLWNALQENR